MGLSEPWLYVALAVCGVVAGVLNVIAGGGSFLTLPLMIFLGLSPSEANGTNRVGILSQNVAASYGFHRHGLFDRRAMLWSALPATVGAVFGTWLALVIPETAFQKILAALMIVVTLWSLKPSKPASSKGEAEEVGDAASVRIPGLVVGFFVVGLYGGFVQAGVGFLVLAATSLAGLDLVRGNAVKVVAILCFSVMALGIFAWQGRVVWAWGLALAVGTTMGGLLGVRLTVLKGHRWVRGVVTVAVIVFALRLLWQVR